jgi:hypothetical protein
VTWVRYATVVEDDAPSNAIMLKHLEFIQSVISRLASDSFLMKGWGLTVAGAFFGFSIKDLNWGLAAVGLLPVAAFWGLDGYFLSRERMYRLLYEAVRQHDASIPPLSMKYESFKNREYWSRYTQQDPGWPSTTKSSTLCLFYGPIMLVGGVVTLLTAFHH